MRKLLLPALAPALFVSTAMAADLPRRTSSAFPQPVYAQPSLFTWTGFYAGVTGGYASAGLGDLGDASFGKPSGYAFGATLGYNHQLANSIVVGVEGDLSWTKIDTSKVVGSAAPYTTYGMDMGWLWTVRGRAGYALDRALLYVTAGYAGASIETTYSNPGSAQPVVPASSGAVDGFRHGWTLGAGLEYAVTNKVSLKGEYLYVNLAEKALFPSSYATKIDPSISLVRMGANYRF